MDIETAYMTGNQQTLRHWVNMYKKEDVNELYRLLDDTVQGGIVSTALFELTSNPEHITNVAYGGLSAQYKLSLPLIFTKQQMHYATFSGTQSCMFLQHAGKGLRAYNTSLEGTIWKDNTGVSAQFEGHSAHRNQIYDNALKHSTWKHHSGAGSHAFNKGMHHAKIIEHAHSMTHFHDDSAWYTQCGGESLFMAKCKHQSFTQSTCEQNCLDYAEAMDTSFFEAYLHGNVPKNLSMTKEILNHCNF